MNISYVFLIGFSTASLELFPYAGDELHTEVGKMVFTKSLGEGDFGAVFRADWKTGGRPVALKVAKPSSLNDIDRKSLPVSDYGEITHEYRMMSLLSKSHGFPRIYTKNFEGYYKYYAMQLLGKDLFTLWREYDSKMPTSLVISIAGQILNRLEDIHRLGYLMYDLHLGNFVLDDGIVYAIDLGMAFPYLVDGKHIEFGESFLPQKYKHRKLSSRRDSEGFMVSRRDEMERFLYLLVTLNVGSLPWEKSRDIVFRKRTATLDEICKGNADWLKPAFRYVLRMRFDEKPNYDKFRKFFDITSQKLMKH